MKCDTPHKEKKFTLMFRRVNPSPFGFEFSEGSYYLICKFSISTQVRGPRTKHWYVSFDRDII